MMADTKSRILIIILCVSTFSFGNGIYVKEVIVNQLDEEYPSVFGVPNKEGCNCSKNNITLSCFCSSLQSALGYLENNTIIMININSITLLSKVRLKHYHNITITGYPYTTIQCNNTGCLQLEACRNTSLENVTFDKCSCKNDSLPAGITIQNSVKLNFKQCKFQNSLSTAVYLENVCGMINFDYVSFWSNRKDALSNVTSTAGLEINNFKDVCIINYINLLNIFITNSLFSNNHNVNCHNCAFAGALQIFVQILNHLSITISHTAFTDNSVESNTDILFNG